MKLTAAEQRALEVMAGSTQYVDGGRVTKVVANHRTVHSATAFKLEKRGFAQGRTEWPDGSPVSEDDHRRHRSVSAWTWRWTITRAGMKAISWIGSVASKRSTQ